MNYGQLYDSLFAAALSFEKLVATPTCNDSSEM